MREPKFRTEMQKFSKGFLQSEDLGEVSVLDGGQFGAKFLAKFAAKFFNEVFGLVLLGHSEQKKLQCEIPMTLHSKTGEISGKTS